MTSLQGPIPPAPELNMTHDRSWQVWRRRAGIAALVLGIAGLAGCMVAPRPAGDAAAARLDATPAIAVAPMDRACSNFACEL
jgi:hypothetical protein